MYDKKRISNNRGDSDSQRKVLWRRNVLAGIAKHGNIYETHTPAVLLCVWGADATIIELCIVSLSCPRPPSLPSDAPRRQANGTNLWRSSTTGPMQSTGGHDQFKKARESANRQDKLPESFKQQHIHNYKHMINFAEMRDGHRSLAAGCIHKQRSISCFEGCPRTNVLVVFAQLLQQSDPALQLDP